MTLREFRILVQQLPGDSHLSRELRKHITERTRTEDLPEDAWDLNQHLLALVVDKIEVLTWIQLDPKTRSSQPAFLPRPGVRRRRGAASWLSGFGISKE